MHALLGTRGTLSKTEHEQIQTAKFQQISKGQHSAAHIYSGLSEMRVQ